MTTAELVDEQMQRLYRLGVMHETQVRAALETVAKKAKQTAEPWTFDGRGPFMHMWKSKTRFHPFTVTPEDIHIQDIAWGLATECRFGGHCPWMSVAEHSMNVSELVRDRNGGVKAQMVGLLHDASEAYLKDIPRPLKYTPAFAQYRELEAKVQAAIYEHFQLKESDGGIALPWADKCMLATEKQELFPEGHPTQSGEMLPLPATMRMHGYVPEVAYNLFLQHFTNLLKMRD